MPDVTWRDDGRSMRIGPGLYYVDRDGETLYTLDREPLPEIGRPDRDVLLALLRYVTDQLEREPADA